MKHSNLLPTLPLRRLVRQAMKLAMPLGTGLLLVGCLASGGQGSGVFGGSKPTSGAQQDAAARAESSTYRAADYANAAKRGPRVIVLPGDIKTTNSAFRPNANNIADFGELELGRANFTVLERSALGSMVGEMQTAFSLGNATQAKRLFEKGQLQSTRWIIKFDVLKAEPVTEASSGFDGAAVGRIVDIVAGNSKAGQISSTTASSTRTAEEAKAWLIGMRYKVIDAATTEQVATGYYEEKMLTGRKSTSILGMSSGSRDFASVDTMVQYLVQKCVAEMDAKNK